MSRKLSKEEYQNTRSFRFRQWLDGSKDPYLDEVEMKPVTNLSKEHRDYSEKKAERKRLLELVYDMKHNTQVKLFKRLYNAFAVLFCVAQIVGGWKLGGNSGNYQVGMVTLVPFAAVAASRMYESFIPESKKRIVVVFGLFVCFVLSGMFLASSAYKIPKQLIPKFQENAAISEYLSANCH